jgi:2,3-bisphosphoglycerate-dependent phosphoglycerate mutase
MLTLIRHAESTANAGEATENPAGIPLTALGHRQAAAYAAGVSRSPSQIIVSPFTRALQTAEPLRMRFTYIPFEIWLVQEFVFFNLPTVTTPQERKPLINAYWDRCDPFEKQLGAESFCDFWLRVCNFRNRLDEYSGEDLFVFSHGFFMKAFEYGWLHGFAPCSKELMSQVYRWKAPRDYANMTLVEYAI